MNTLFLIAYALLLLLNLFSDIKRMRKQHNSLKGLYVTLYTLSAAMYLCIVLRVEITMPTRFFINRVSPWVVSIIQP
jgi:hypothetical protein